MTAATGERRSLLRIATAGSVDDGKSTLIGRLLHDSQAVYQDQLLAVIKHHEDQGGKGVNLALITDGLRAEREQGITIDAAYRYFSTAVRKFIIADVPGHEQYTRNMFTGISTADVSVVLVDAGRGLTDQSRRHLLIARLLRIPQLVLVVNKMDLVGYRQQAFAELAGELQLLCQRLGIETPAIIPMSALNGDNVIQPSERMDWYCGPTLMQHLERVEIAPVQLPLRFAVQWVCRPGMVTQTPHYRGYAGQLASGEVAVGDQLLVMPQGLTATVTGIDRFEGPVQRASAGESVMLQLDRELDISRGSVLLAADNPVAPIRQFQAVVCWFGDQPLVLHDRYRLQIGTRVVNALIEAVRYCVDMGSLSRASAEGLQMNDVGVVSIRVQQPVVADHFCDNRHFGRCILIDRSTNSTVAAGLIGSELTDTLDQEAA